MKKLVITFSLILIATVGFCQLEVHPNNNVSVGSSTTPSENFYVENSTQLRCFPAIKGLFFESPWVIAFNKFTFVCL